MTDVLAVKYSAKGPLTIRYYEYDELPEEACVTYAPLTLHIVRKIWDDAKVGKPYARFMIAHEIGHILLHDETAAAFSHEDEARPAYRHREDSAENQANTFADLFLVPDHIALKIRDADAIEALCVVANDVAERRLVDAIAEKHPLRPLYAGEMCSTCGNFTLVQNGTSMKCDTCGNTTRESLYRG